MITETKPKTKRENTVKFTDIAIQSWKPRDKQFEKWELGRGGFGVRISQGGTKTFIYFFRFEGTLRRMSLGVYPQTSLAQAHIFHAEARLKVQNGIDPALEKKEGVRIDREAVTFRELADLYMAEHSRLEKKSWREDERKLKVTLLPAFGLRKAASIQPAEISDLVEKMKRDVRAKKFGTGKIAGDTLNLIAAIYKHGIKRGRVSENPCVAVSVSVKVNKRRRYLTGQEIKAFWNGIEKTRMSRTTQLVFKLILTTGARKADVLQIEKGDVDLEGRWWSQPESKTKNGEPHKVYLNDLALEIVREAWKLSEDSNWLFPGPGAEGFLTPRSLNKALHRAQDQEKNPGIFDPEIFTEGVLNPHDLRRTLATHLSKDKRVGRFITNRVLGHVDRDAHQDLSIMEHYDQNSYINELQEALEVWNELLEGFIFA